MMTQTRQVKNGVVWEDKTGSYHQEQEVILDCSLMGNWKEDCERWQAGLPSEAQAEADAHERHLLGEEE